MDLTEIVTNTTTSLLDTQTIVDLDQGLINQDHWIINIFEYGTWLMGKMNSAIVISNITLSSVQ